MRRFIPVSIMIPPSIAKFYADDGDAAVIAAVNNTLAGHTGIRLQPLEPEQFVAAFEAPIDPTVNDQAPKPMAGKSPRQIARAKKRVARLQKKTRRTP